MALGKSNVVGFVAVAALVVVGYFFGGDAVNLVKDAVSTAPVVSGTAVVDSGTPSAVESGQ